MGKPFTCTKVGELSICMRAEPDGRVTTDLHPDARNRRKFVLPPLADWKGFFESAAGRRLDPPRKPYPGFFTIIFGWLRHKLMHQLPDSLRKHSFIVICQRNVLRKMKGYLRFYKEGFLPADLIVYRLGKFVFITSMQADDLEGGIEKPDEEKSRSRDLEALFARCDPDEPVPSNRSTPYYRFHEIVISDNGPGLIVAGEEDAESIEIKMSLYRPRNGRYVGRTVAEAFFQNAWSEDLVTVLAFVDEQDILCVERYSAARLEVEAEALAGSSPDPFHRSVETVKYIARELTSKKERTPYCLMWNKESEVYELKDCTDQRIIDLFENHTRTLMTALNGLKESPGVGSFGCHLFGERRNAGRKA